MCSIKAGGHVLDVALKQCGQIFFGVIFRVANMQAEMEQDTRYQFNETFDDFNPPVYLSNLVQWILLEPDQNLTSESREFFWKECFSFSLSSFEKNLATKFIMQPFMTKNQMSYNTMPGSQCQVSNCVGTPLAFFSACFIKH